jgi:DNA-binding XRE family transcriptional regulator
MARMYSGDHLRSQRELAGLKREHVALAVQRSTHTIREYEWGRVTPSVSTLARIADLFGCSLDQFFKVTAEETADVAA